MSFHPNDELNLRDMLRIGPTDPFPPSAAEIYHRARWISEASGTGSMQPAALVGVVMRIQDAEIAAGRPAPGMPPERVLPVPQHQRRPKSLEQQAEDAEPEKRGPGRPRKETVSA